MSNSVKVRKLESDVFSFTVKRIIILGFSLGLLYTFLVNNFNVLLSEIYLNNYTFDYYIIFSVAPWLLVIIFTFSLRQVFKKAKFDFDENEIFLFLYLSFLIISLGCLIGYMLFLDVSYPFIIVTIFKLYFNNNIVLPPTYGLFDVLLISLFFGFQIFIVIFFLLFYYSKKDFSKSQSEEFKFDNGLIYVSFIAVFLSVALDIINQTIFLFSGFYASAFSSLLYSLKIIILLVALDRAFKYFIFKSMSKKFLVLNIRFGYLIITSIGVVGALIYSILFNLDYYSTIASIFQSLSWSYYLTGFVFLMLFISTYDN